MKKFIALILAVVFVFGLSACGKSTDDIIDCIDNPDAEGCEVCPEGQELQGTECVDIVEPVTCETGYHEEAGECVPDTVTCETGYHEEAGECVPDPVVCETGYINIGDQCVPDPSIDPELVATAIVNNWDGSMEFLALAMSEMDFSNAVTMRFEANFEIVEDGTETHNINAVVEDSFVYAETGDTVKRTIDVDFDGELFTFTMYLHEVETGVHVYIQPELILDSISQGNPEVEATLGYMGFTHEWAVFEFDDSLETVIQVEVLKEMLVSLFFSEMGDDYFTRLQSELEYELDFDLNQYGLDLGAIVDELIEEDFAQAEILLQGINVEGIILNIDYLYIAPELYAILTEYETELIAAGFSADISLLNTTEWNSETGEYDYLSHPLTAPIVGTEVFLASLTLDDIDDLIEVVIKPLFEEALWNMLEEEVDTQELKMFLYNYMDWHRYWLEDPNTPGIYGRSWDVDAQRAELNSLGLIAYWEQLTEQERWDLYDAQWNDYYDEWQEEKLWEIEDRVELENEIIDILTAHQTDLEALSIPVAAYILSINTIGLEAFVDTLTPTDMALFADAIIYPFVEDLHQAVLDEEVFEFVMDAFFGHPHITSILADPEMDFPFDASIFGTNMMMLDLDAWELETIDMELLAVSIYEGQTAFDLFVTGLEVSSPNWAYFLEPWSPAVLELQPYMVYLDDIQYAFDGLSAFEEFINPDYYMEDVFDVSLEVVPEDFHLLTTLAIDGSGYSMLFDDFKDALGIYLAGFEILNADFPYDETWTCLDPLDENCDDVEFAEIIANLYSQGEIVITAEFDPTNLTWCEFTIDATDFADELVKMSNAYILDDPEYVIDETNDIWHGVTELVINYSIVTSAEITLPLETETDNVNEIAEDLSKFAVSMFAFDYLRYIGDYYMIYPEELPGLFVETQPVPLSYFEWLEVSKAFDAEMSTIGLTVDLELGVPVPGTEDFELTLYWIDGTAVFDAPISLSDWFTIMVDGDLASQASYDLMIGQINEDNWAMTKVFLMVLLEEAQDSIYRYGPE